MRLVLFAQTFKEQFDNHPIAPLIFSLVLIVVGIVSAIRGKYAIRTKRFRGKYGHVTKGKSAVSTGKFFVGFGGLMVAIGAIMLLYNGAVLLANSIGGIQTAQQPTTNNPTTNNTNPFGVDSGNGNTGTTNSNPTGNANGSATPLPAVIPKTVQPPKTTTLPKTVDDSLRPLHSMSQEKTAGSLAFSPDGKLLLSADGPRFNGRDSSPWHVYIWDVASGQLRQKMDLKFAAKRVRFAPEGGLVAVSDIKAKLTLWEIPSGNPIKTIDTKKLPGGRDGYGYDFDFVGGSKTLILAGNAGIAVLDLETVEVTKSWKNHMPITLVVDTTNDGTKAITGGSGDEFVVVSLPSGGIIDRFRTASKQAEAVAISNDGRRAIVRSSRTNLSIWDLENRKNLFAIPEDSAMSLAIAISPDGRHVASTMARPPVVYIWNTDSGKVIAQFTRHSRAVMAVTISPDGRLAASGDYNGLIQLWEMPVD